MDQHDWQVLAERLYMTRRRRKLTSKALARKVGTAPATISRLENDKKPYVSFDVLERIADALGVSLDYLAGKTEQERPGSEDTAAAVGSAAVQPTAARESREWEGSDSGAV